MIGAFIPATGGVPIVYLICHVCWAGIPQPLLAELAEQLLSGAA